MSIKCGNCKQHHETIAEVKACCAGAVSQRTIDMLESEPPRMCDFAQPHPYGSRICPVCAPAPRDVRSPQMPESMRKLRDGDTIINRNMGAPVDRSQNLPADVQAQARRDAYGRPARMATLPTVVTEDGIYLSPLGEIYKVVFNKAQGSGRRLYAKKLVIWDDNVPYSAGLLALPSETTNGSRMEWTYAPGAMRDIRPEWKMSVADAERFGKLYGRCFKCHRVLTKEESIARSMGDICAGKQGF